MPQAPLGVVRSHWVLADAGMRPVVKVGCCAATRNGYAQLPAVVRPSLSTRSALAMRALSIA